ncbi:AAA family ATPase [Leptospira haakeii]|uniref:Protein CR006 P-loop domain-containing protein n=1 Tax=Leptospira haakeii TaxID=2023198 RepID=A0ABX4PEX6_9LEPT|nr:AAA family ATPase [Leptospira haakeii]PKA14319.1 hypothetical protein CH363_19150 [Leptospira haakeii]PKA18177.1 hypothetical protein CH377_18905 [Leptospira haakeii]
MIESVEIKKIASYDEHGITLNNLKSINYIYGANGSGKTSISKVLRKPENYSDSRINWKGGVSIQTLVYNKEFIDENFYQDENVKGIFTLGEESQEKREQINLKKKEIDDLSQGNINLEASLKLKKEELDSIESQFEEKCWILKQQYDSDFKPGFKGVRNSKTEFKEKFLQEINNPDILLTREQIVETAQTVFSNSLEKVNLFNSFDVNALSVLEKDLIFEKVIVGKDNIQIANVINKLKISDWVKAGHVHLKSSEGICPFCQQKIPEDLPKQLEDYFDESYNTQINQVESLSKSYKSQYSLISSFVTDILNGNSSYLKLDSIDQQKKLLESKIQTNLILIDKKTSEPSSIVKIKSIAEEISLINIEIDIGNAAIKKHNSLIDNITEEKRKLISQIWRFIVETGKDNHSEYLGNKENVSKAISGISSRIADSKAKIDALSEEIRNIESQITSITPTITVMNRILNSFGFENFRFDVAEEAGQYKIIRPSGESAKDTLSEGEKTFITFLYFYHLLSGSVEKDSITVDRIIVFDDPVSSLDSNILFIVSNLIRSVIEQVRSTSLVKQVFILTHNIYFHKEVTFNKNRAGSDRLTDETFWLLRKKEQKSSIEICEKNPIKTSYELLWHELQKAIDEQSNTLQNIMRRIIENYFKILARVGDDELINKFEPDEKILCRSLFSWVNDGSHIINEDLFVQYSPELNEKYLEVFKKIFKLTDQEGHYNMMMSGIH